LTTLDLLRSEMKAFTETTAYRILREEHREKLVINRKVVSLTPEDYARQVNLLDHPLYPEMMRDRQNVARGQIQANEWAELEGFGLLPAIEEAISQKMKEEE